MRLQLQIIASLMTLAAQFAHAGLYAFHQDHVLGTSFEMQVRAPTKAAAEAAFQQGLVEIQRLNQVLSGYDEQSEMRRWQRGELRAAEISADTHAVVRASANWHARTGGAFNPAVEAAAALWKQAAVEQRIPRGTELATAAAAIRDVVWPQLARATALPASLPPMTFDGLAKGYILDKAAAAAMASPQVAGVMLNIGGDLCTLGEISIATAVANPFADAENGDILSRVALRQNALATSGGHQRFVNIAGKRLSHIIDPRTALPVNHIASASVLASNATAADALATAMVVLTPTQSLQLAREQEAACLLVTRTGDIVASENWPDPAVYQLRLAQAEPRGKNSPQHWGNTHELHIGFEIATPKGVSEYRRPYVALWVCDEEGFPVRTLLLWYQRGGARWLPSLRQWNRDEILRQFTEESDLADTVSRATRPPGHYEVIWNGKDDLGHPVAAGKYTLHVEASREHGTHQTMQIELNLGDDDFSETLEGNTEIETVRVTYRPIETR